MNPPAVVDDPLDASCQRSRGHLSECVYYVCCSSATAVLLELLPTEAPHYNLEAPSSCSPDDEESF